MKLDMTKKHKDYYGSSKTPDVREFLEINYLTILGKGDPNGPEFDEAVSSLYPVAYGIKKIYKEKELDFVVGKLEGLWWVEGDQEPLETPREEWYWKLLIRMPEFVDESDYAQILKLVAEKKKQEKILEVKFEPLLEGKCVQVMHIGPYSEEPASLKLIYDYVKENGYEIVGKHHEIYLSDPRKANPETMKTILRYPIR